MITSQIFQYAISVRLLTNNPMNGVIRPKDKWTLIKRIMQRPTTAKNN